MRKGQRLWTLFSSMLYISAFTFGGGFVIIPLMRKKFVEKLKWIDDHHVKDLFPNGVPRDFRSVLDVWEV